MSGPGPNTSGNPGPNAGTTTRGTTTGTTSASPMLPFLAGLSLPDLDRLTNDPIHHDASWLAMLKKLPSDIPKFERLAGEDPSNHVRSFHMWCSSNSITDDSFCLRLFQHVLTGEASKWYVDQDPSSYTTFATIARVFLSYFQLPLRYDTGTKLLTSFRQSSATCLCDHVQKWWRKIGRAHV